MMPVNVGVSEGPDGFKSLKTDSNLYSTRGCDGGCILAAEVGMNWWVRGGASIILLMATAIAVRAQDTGYPPASEQIPGPNCAPVPEWNSSQAPKACSKEESGAWLADVRHWRMERRIRAGYFDTEYTRPELKWT